MSLKITVFDEKLNKTEEGFKNLEDFEVRYVLLAEVVKAELANLRAGNAHTKTRSEVRGGGKKPWKQKGTGRARHGSNRSPIWVGGGVAFGPRSLRNWHQKINKSARISALKSVVKDRLVHEAVFVFPQKFDFTKTKDAAEVLETFNTTRSHKAKHSALVYTTADKEALRGFTNTGVELINAHNIKVFKLMNAKNVILTPQAKEVLETRLA